MNYRRISARGRSDAWTAIFAAVIILAVTCHPARFWKDLRTGDFTLVEEGTYRGFPRYMQHPGAYEAIVRQCRAQIEKNTDLMPLITDRFFAVTKELHFQYKFTSIDSVSQCLIMRYFARIADDPLYAGYQIQFVYALRQRDFVRVFTSRVPLE
jgi:hypothetical protein